MGLKVDTIQEPTSATVNLTLGTTGSVTVGANLAVTGTTTLTGGVTQTGSSTAASFIPSGSTVPTNGVFLPSANTVAIATNTTNQVSISSGGIVTGTAGNLMLVSATSQTAPFTTNTQCDFTGIPSWAKRVSIIFSGVSTSSTSPMLIQLGSGSITSTGYASGGWTSSATYATATNGLLVSAAIVAAAVQHGVYTLANVTGNTWVGSGSVADSSGNNYTGIGSGTIALSGALDRIRVTTATGTPTFDTGSIINIQYE